MEDWAGCAPDLLDRFREPPARAYSPEPEGVGRDKPDGDDLGESDCVP